MRQIILDTETTGLSVDDGHRIIEIGCLEVVDRRSTSRHLHLYVNPERKVDEGALAVHGISDDQLVDKPKFAEIARQFIDFVRGAEILIHNAAFDVGFLDAELGRAGLGRFADHVAGIVDTLAMARELHPGKRNSLDSLCDRYGISNAHRKLHGALLDAELLAEVYLAMTRGQDSLAIVDGVDAGGDSSSGDDGPWPPSGLRVLAAGEAALAAHEATLAAIAKEARKPAVWLDAG
ncbi:MAG: DNA polymerase III subunit epsilon [Burkholderiaceae bacterium]